MIALKKMLILSAATVVVLGGALEAYASDSGGQPEVAKTPVTITFNGVQAGEVPFYVSIQTEEEYRSVKGYGGVLKTTESGSFTRSFDVPEGGYYAVTIWHDLDDDGLFSMTEDYQVKDGWGSSGTIPRGTSPSFNEAKVIVSSYGTSIDIDMIYPEG